MMPNQASYHDLLQSQHLQCQQSIQPQAQVIQPPQHFQQQPPPPYHQIYDQQHQMSCNANSNAEDNVQNFIPIQMQHEPQLHVQNQQESMCQQEHDLYDSMDYQQQLEHEQDHMIFDRPHYHQHFNGLEQPTDQLQQQQQQQQQQATGQHPLTQQLNILSQATRQSNELLSSCCQTQEDLNIKILERAKLLARVRTLETNQDINGTLKTKEDLAKLDLNCRIGGRNLKENRKKLLVDLKTIFCRMSTIQRSVLEEHLAKWQQDQQAQNKYDKTNKSDTSFLDQIQVWVELLTDITWKIRNQLKAYLLYLSTNLNQECYREVNNLFLHLNKSLETLVLNTFVVEKQPPQVMKTHTRFTSSVRFLSGPGLNVQFMTPTVKAVILSESNARAIIQRHKDMIDASWRYLENGSPIGPMMGQTSPDLIQQQAQSCTQYQQQISNNDMVYSTPTTTPGLAQQQQVPVYYPPAPPPQPQKILNINEFEPSGEIMNNSNILECQESTRQLVCNFKNMQLKKIRRAEKKGTESVMDEKFILLFHSEFRIADTHRIDNSTCSNQTNPNPWINQSDLTFHIMAYSLPVVVIVHGSQEADAWGTITWHNAFAKPDNLLYQVPDRVAWSDLARVLSGKFQEFAGKGLGEQNLGYLAYKVSRGQMHDGKLLQVTWNQFAKENLPNRQFTFWDWFYSILKLSKEHLRDLWMADRIYGFIGKKKCIDLLLGSAFEPSSPVGSFLLRFSETEIGGISIAFVAETLNQTEPERYITSSIQLMQRRSPNSASTTVLAHLQPYISSDLKTRSLADRIMDLDEIMYLYPNIPKEQVFMSYSTKTDDTPAQPNDYVPRNLIESLRPNCQSTSTTNSPMMECIAAATPVTSNSHAPSSSNSSC